MPAVEFTPLETTGQRENKKMSQAGFTLVEVVVALLILLVTTSGILASFVVAKRYTARAKRRISAINYARQQLERLFPYSHQGPNGWNNPANPLYAADPGPSTQPYGPVSLPDEFGIIWGGTSRYTVTNTTSTTWRRVNVVINWNEPNAP